MGVDIGRERARQQALRAAYFKPRSLGHTSRLIETPSFLMPVTRVESYPLGDWIYNRGRAISDLVRAELSWRYYLNRQPPNVLEAIDKVTRLFRNQNKTD
jgi:hypothetical protein